MAPADQPFKKPPGGRSEVHARMLMQTHTRVCSAFAHGRDTYVNCSQPILFLVVVRIPAVMCVVCARLDPFGDRRKDPMAHLPVHFQIKRGSKDL